MHADKSALRSDKRKGPLATKSRPQRAVQPMKKQAVHSDSDKSLELPAQARLSQGTHTSLEVASNDRNEIKQVEVLLLVYTSFSSQLDLVSTS